MSKQEKDRAPEEAALEYYTTIGLLEYYSVGCEVLRVEHLARARMSLNCTEDKHALITKQSCSDWGAASHSLPVAGVQLEAKQNDRGSPQRGAHPPHLCAERGDAWYFAGCW